MKSIVELKSERAKLADEMKALTELVSKEDRAYSDDENKRFEELDAQIKDLSDKITAKEREEKARGFSDDAPNTLEDKNVKPALFDVVKVNGQMGLRLNDTAMTKADGGAAIAPEQFVADLERDIAKEALVYARVAKIPVTGAGSLGLPYEAADVSDAEWTAEVPDSEITEDTSWKFGKRSLAPTDLTKLIKVSKKLLATSALPIDTLARERIAEKLTAAFENTILNGTGTDQPLGLFTASDNGIPTSRDTATATAATIAADDIINVYMSLRPVYRRNAVWVMHTSTLKQVMKLKDNDGQYLWHESLRVGEPSTLLGLPVIESEYAPEASATGDYALLLGDLSKYKFAYWKGLDITVANEKFAGTNQVGFYGHTLADGCPTLPNAFARLKLA